MLLNILKLIGIIILIFFTIYITLKIFLKEIYNKKLIRISIYITCIISIYFVLFFYDNKKENFEEVINSEVDEQNKELEKNVEENIEGILTNIENKSITEPDIIEDGPKLNTNKSQEKIAIDETENQVEISKKLPELQEDVLESPDVIEKPLLNEEKREEPKIEIKSFSKTELEKEIEKKYNILPVEQWVKPDAKDIFKKTPCMCPSVSNYNDAYALY